MKDATQGRRLIALLKRRGMTNLQLQLTGISTSHWKRIREQLRDGERLIAAKNAENRNVYRVVKA